MFLIPLGFISFASCGLEALFGLLRAAGCFGPPGPRGPASPQSARGGPTSVWVLFLLLAGEASQPRAEQHGGGSPCPCAVVGPADFTLT